MGAVERLGAEDNCHRQQAEVHFWAVQVQVRQVERVLRCGGDDGGKRELWVLPKARVLIERDRSDYAPLVISCCALYAPPWCVVRGACQPAKKQEPKSKNKLRSLCGGLIFNFGFV